MKIEELKEYVKEIKSLSVDFRKRLIETTKFIYDMRESITKIDAKILKLENEIERRIQQDIDTPLLGKNPSRTFQAVGRILEDGKKEET